MYLWMVHECTCGRYLNVLVDGTCGCVNAYYASVPNMRPRYLSNSLTESL